MGAAAQLHAAADAQDPHALAVLLAEQHQGAGFRGRLQVHHAGIGRLVGQDFRVDHRLDLMDLRRRHRRVVGKVEARALGVYEAAFLLDMRAQHLAQRHVHQVGGAVVAHRRVAPRGVDAGGNLVADLQHALGLHPVVAEHVGLDLLRVLDAELQALGAQRAGVADLATALCIERRCVQHHDSGFAFLQLLH